MAINTESKTIMDEGLILRPSPMASTCALRSPNVKLLPDTKLPSAGAITLRELVLISNYSTRPCLQHKHGLVVNESALQN